MKWFKKLAALVLAVGLVLAMAGCSWESGPARIDYEQSREILAKINTERRKKGYEELTLDRDASSMLVDATKLEQAYALHPEDAALKKALNDANQAAVANLTNRSLHAWGHPAQEGSVNAYTLQGGTYQEVLNKLSAAEWEWAGNVKEADRAAVVVYENDGNITVNVWFLREVKVIGIVS